MVTVESFALDVAARKLLLLIAVLVELFALNAPCFAVANEQQGLEQRRQLINADWRFLLGDQKGAEAPGYVDQQWQRIGLPHTFGLPYFGASEFYVGYGWYRKQLLLDALLPKHRYALEFEGVFQCAEIYVNGIKAGGHAGGYTGFQIDVTPFLHAGKNQIAVRVNNLWNAQLNPRAGEHNFNGGIYRNVYWVVTNDLHVAWYGTFVTTPDLDADGGSVHVATEVRNDGGKDAVYVLRSTLLDQQNHILQQVESTLRLSAHQQQTVQQKTDKVMHPALWSPEHPSLYKLHTEILVNKEIVDAYETVFGFRTIKWTADKGFFLNGEHRYFHGADVHQDHAGWGDAVTNAGVARDIRMLKEAGMDFIRGSHYPHSPAFSQECDQQGMSLWSENSFWGTGRAKGEGYWTSSAYPPNVQDQKPFEENVKTSLEEMIRIHRNHPSIITWSLTNEVFFSDPALLPKIRSFMAELVNLSHYLDPTRAVAAGGVQRGELDSIADIAGYNGDGALLFQNPGHPSVVSEYGSVESLRPGAFEPG